MERPRRSDEYVPQRTMNVGPTAPRTPGIEPGMYDEWQAWQRVVDALRNASASIDINEEPTLAAAIEMWGELLVRLRLSQDPDIVDQALDDKIARYNTLVR